MLWEIWHLPVAFSAEQVFPWRYSVLNSEVEWPFRQIRSWVLVNGN